MTDASTLNSVLESTAGVVGAVLATTAGRLHAVRGTVSDAERIATTAAALANQLAAIGILLGMGALDVVSAKAPSAARVFACQGEVLLAVELDAKRSIGELETKLRTVAWAPDAALRTAPQIERATEEPAAAITIGRPTRRTIPSAAPAVERDRSRQRTAIPPLAAEPVPADLASIGSGPVFTGDLDAFCLPDLLEFLRNSQRSGRLLCTSEAGIGTVDLTRGMVIGADSPHALDLRAHFSANPDLDPAHRRELASLPDECFRDHLLDGAVVTHNLVPREEVERARVARIYSAFRELMSWTEGRFSFDPAVPVAADPKHTLNVQTILMRICQERDDPGR